MRLLAPARRLDPKDAALVRMRPLIAQIWHARGAWFQAAGAHAFAIPAFEQALAVDGRLEVSRQALARSRAALAELGPAAAAAAPSAVVGGAAPAPAPAAPPRP